MTTKSLTHIAFIMDGNRRWAKKRGLPVAAGHKKGAETLVEIAKAAKSAGIKYMTVYAFSTENWQREPEEVAALMDLLRQYLERGFKELQENNARIIFIGERQMLADDIRIKMAEIEQQTANNTDVTLCVALSYGGRQEITAAARFWHKRCKTAKFQRKILMKKCLLMPFIPQTCRIRIYSFAPAVKCVSATIYYGRRPIRSFILRRHYGRILQKKN